MSLPTQKRITKVELRYLEALKEAGFEISRVYDDWLIKGYGKAVLAPKLSNGVKSLLNRLKWRGDEVGADKLYEVMHGIVTVNFMRGARFKSFPDAIGFFMANLGAPNENGCMEWMGRRAKSGYGEFWIAAKHVLAHRYAAWAYGWYPAPGIQVCHKCDNPPCCNPYHLFLGTPQDNALDCYKKGRAKGLIPIGDRRNEKLTPEEVALIRASDKTQMELAAELGVNQGDNFQCCF